MYVSGNAARCSYSSFSTLLESDSSTGLLKRSMYALHTWSSAFDGMTIPKRDKGESVLASKNLSDFLLMTVTALYNHRWSVNLLVISTRTLAITSFSIWLVAVASSRRYCPVGSNTTKSSMRRDGVAIMRRLAEGSQSTNSLQHFDMSTNVASFRRVRTWSMHVSIRSIVSLMSVVRFCNDSSAGFNSSSTLFIITLMNGCFYREFHLKVMSREEHPHRWHHWQRFGWPFLPLCLLHRFGYRGTCMWH